MKTETKKYIKENPGVALNWSYKETIKKIGKLIGKENLLKAMQIEKAFPSPVCKEKSSDWLKKSKIIGINPRIIRSYFNIVKYALTFPEDTIHIMPIWEEGCGGSIYARVNWKLSSQWLDNELVEQGYTTPEQQLKLVVNLLHSLGKKVGFDTVGHTDKFSEEVFILPDCFEWIKLNDSKTSQIKFSDTEMVYPELKSCIIEFLKKQGCADKSEFKFAEIFYSDEFSYEKRERILFGENRDLRTQRRIMLMNYVREQGFETIPVTEHAPCRPIVFKEIVKENGSDYADFKVVNKTEIAKIFNSITPYRWYKISSKGYPEIDKPIEKTFNYFFERVSSFQKEYNFDFLRSDMAHNQIAHSHESEKKDETFSSEMWRLLKEHIQKDVPYFATFAETFFSDYYIDGISDIKNKNFDVILGISNFKFLDSEFLDLIKYQMYISEKHGFSSCVVSITNDSDQEHNNKYHQSPLANELRYFFQMFLTLPGYTGMGFELRDAVPLDTTGYSGVYTNYQKDAYQWGKNQNMFDSVSKMRKLYSRIFDRDLEATILDVQSNDCLVWLLSKENKPLYLCVVNLNKSADKSDIYFDINSKFDYENKKLVPMYSLKENDLFCKTIDLCEGCLKNIEFADAKIYKIEDKIFSKKSKKNKKQLLFVTTEFAPYAKSGGLADYGADYIKAFNAKTDFDARVIMPLYNSICANFSKDEAYIELFDKYENNKPKRFLIEDTGIETKFNWGINSSFAKLYKIKNTVNNICVYLVYSPTFSEMEKEYTGDFVTFPAAFSAAVCALLKSLSSLEKFNPSIVQLNDHLTSNVGLLIKELKKQDKFYRGIKIIYTFHNFTDLGKYSVLNLLFDFFTKKQIERIVEDSEISVILNLIKEEYKGQYEFTDNMSVLRYLSLNIKNLYDTQNENFEFLYKIFSKKFLGEICFHFCFTQKIISACDRWITVSKTMYNDIVSDKYKDILTSYKDSLSYIFEGNKEKGCGILSGIESQLYSPENSEEIKYPYSCDNFKEGKKKNKLYIQKQFSKKNIEEKNIDFSLFTNYKSAKIWGNLTENSESLIILFAARLEKVKGFDYLKAILPELLIEYPNLQIIIAGKDTLNETNRAIFDSSVMNPFKDSGQIVVIDDFINIKQYYASCDLFLFPSIMESCGLTVMQAMRYGTPVVANLTGCVNEIIVSPEENPESANGFKVSEYLSEDAKSSEIYKAALTNAIDTFISNNEIKNVMIKNAMLYDTSWNDIKIQKYKDVFESLGEFYE